jgi:hypothetical protein
MWLCDYVVEKLCILPHSHIENIDVAFREKKIIYTLLYELF